MRKLVWAILLSVIAGLRASAGDFQSERAQQWNRWRGPDATGVAPFGNPPIRWDANTNVRWKVAVPGLGNSTPIIWGDQIFLLTAISTDQDGAPAAAESKDADAPKSRSRTGKGELQGDPKNAQSGDVQKGRGDSKRRSAKGGGGSAPTNPHRFVILSYDRRSGALNWERTAAEIVPHEGFREGDNSFASGSPVTNGTHLYASFGSYGIFCYDLQGELVWKQDLGDMRTRNGFGEGASPALHGDRLVVPWDHEEQSRIFVLDANAGKTLWQAERDEPTAWATPLVVEHQGKTQVVVNATNRVRSYDLDSGKLLWECGGQTTNAIPSPVLFGENVICMSGFRGNALFSIPLGSTGDVTNSGKLAWYFDGQTQYRPPTPYVPSPLLYGDLLYFNKGNNAILSCLNAQTGDVLYDNQRLPGLGTIYASPVGASDRIYIVDRQGTTLVLKRGPDFEVLATNTLDDPMDASPAVVGNEIFLRGKKYLWAIASE